MNSGFRYVVGISLVLVVGATTSAVGAQPQSQPKPLSSPVEVASGWSVDRVGERDRYSTAAKVSERFFTAPASTVFVANGEGFADALAGGAAAGLAGAPLLLTARDQLPAVTAAEINRLNPERVVVLGGANAVSSAVEQGLGEGRSVVRLSGATRYSTAVEISKFQFPGSAPVVFIANGENFADGLAGGPSAATRGGPLLLVLPDALPAEVAAEIQRLGARDAVVLGGANAVSASVVGQLEALGLTVNRRAGSDRYGTAVSITSQSFTTAATAVLVTGMNFPDALTSGSLAKRLGAPLLLTRTDCMPPAVIAELQRLQVSNVLVVGGTGAVTPGSATGIQCLAEPPPIVQASDTVVVSMSVGMTRAVEYFAARGHVLRGPGNPVSASIVGGSGCAINGPVVRAVSPGLCSLRVTGPNGAATIAIRVIDAPGRSGTDRPGANVLDIKPVYIRFSDSPDAGRDVNGEVATFAQGISDLLSVQYPGFALRVDEINGVPDVQHIQLPITTEEFVRRSATVGNLTPLGPLLIEAGINPGMAGFFTQPTPGTYIEDVTRIMVGFVEGPRGPYISPGSPNDQGGCGSSSGNPFVVYFVRDIDGSLCPGISSRVFEFKGTMGPWLGDDAFRIALDLLRGNPGCTAKIASVYGLPLEARPSALTSPQDPIAFQNMVGSAVPRVFDPQSRFYFQMTSGPDVGNPCVDLVYSPFLSEWSHTSWHDDQAPGRSTTDRPDDVAGPQARFLYVLPADAPDRKWDLDGRLHSAASSANNWLFANGQHSMRFDSFGGRLDVGFARLPLSEAQLWLRPDGTKCTSDEICPNPRRIVSLLEQMGALTPGKIHVIVWGGQMMPLTKARGIGCAGAMPDVKATFQTPLMRSPVFSLSRCFNDFVAQVPDSQNSLGLISLHEIFHVLGAVDPKAPDADNEYHIANDPTDLMGGSADIVRLDPRRRNYWAHGRSDIVDVTRSPYLVAGPSTLAPPIHSSLNIEWWVTRPPQWDHRSPARSG